MSRDDDLRDLLNETANEISRLTDSPRTWLSWMVYLLERLESEATGVNPADKETFVDMLSALQDELRNRVRTGGWH